MNEFKNYKIGEVWTYIATKPSDNLVKVRPILIVGNDEDNGLNFVDINYTIISSSAMCGKYDVELNEMIATQIGLNKASVIKTTKIYTGSKMKLGSKIGELPQAKREEFKQKYKEYQDNLLNKW